jgi:hypothetical protein
MSIAEQKLAIAKMLLEADDETTNQLFQLMLEGNNRIQKFSDQEIEMFEKSRDEFFASGEKGYSVEEVHSSIRNRIKK